MSTHARPDRAKDPLGGTSVGAETASVLESERKGGGTPLPLTVRRGMEHQFGADLSNVRVHTGTVADGLAQDVSARAFTVGSDIFFRQGAYAPSTDRGQHTLAHELAHVVQGHTSGGSGGGSGLTVGEADAPEEHAAEKTATEVVSNLRRMPVGEPVTGSLLAPSADAATPHTIARMADCSCCAPVLRRDPEDGDVATRPRRPRGVNLGNNNRGLVMGANRRRGVRLPSDFDVMAMGGEQEAEQGPVNAPEVQQGPIASPLDTFLLSMGDPAKNTVEDNIPSHGLGRFDAQYLPHTGELLITVRPRFTFAGTWTENDKQGFIDNFVNQTRSKWSGAHDFVCVKDGFETLRAKVAVQVVPADKLTDRAHFECTIHDQKGGDTYIGREQYNDKSGNTLAQGVFGKKDETERAHDNLKTRCTLAMHDYGRITGMLADVLTDQDDRKRSMITCTKTGLEQSQVEALEKFVTVVNHSAELGATPVPIILTYHESRFDFNAKKRVAAVTKILNKIKGNPIKIVAAATELKQLKQSNKDSLAAFAKDKNKGYKKGGRYDTEARENISKREEELSSTNMTLHADEAWAMAYKETDPYSILAHEFGHMLGNPDEYFGYGEKLLALKRDQLMHSGDEADKLTAARLKASELATGDTNDIQGNWGELVVRSGNKLPTMTTKGSSATTSIMNAGAIVLPAHYATLWEALGRITAKANPALAEADWKFA